MVQLSAERLIGGAWAPVGGSGPRRPESAAARCCSRLAPRMPWVGRFRLPHPRTVHGNVHFGSERQALRDVKMRPLIL